MHTVMLILLPWIVFGTLSAFKLGTWWSNVGVAFVLEAIYISYLIIMEEIEDWKTKKHKETIDDRVGNVRG